jgi:4-hydroxyphenylpyruvate dioxygenase-like putative hemolysin
MKADFRTKLCRAPWWTVSRDGGEHNFVSAHPPSWTAIAQETSDADADPKEDFSEGVHRSSAGRRFPSRNAPATRRQCDVE